MYLHLFLCLQLVYVGVVYKKSVSCSVTSGMWKKAVFASIFFNAHLHVQNTCANSPFDVTAETGMTPLDYSVDRLVYIEADEPDVLSFPYNRIQRLSLCDGFVVLLHFLFTTILSLLRSIGPLRHY